MEEQNIINTPLRPDADLQFESLLREANGGKEHAQDWDTGDAIGNILGIVIPVLVTVILHKYPQFTFTALMVISLNGFRRFFRARLKDQRQLGLSLIAGSALGLVAWVLCIMHFGLGTMNRHVPAAAPLAPTTTLPV